MCVVIGPLWQGPCGGGRGDIKHKVGKVSFVV